MVVRRIKRRKAKTRAELIAAASRARCGICERDDQPIAMADDMNAPSYCLPASQWKNKGGIPEWVNESKDVCYDCQALWSAWLFRVCAVMRKVRESIGREHPRYKRLEELLEPEAFQPAHPNLEKWERKLKLAAA